MMIVTLVFSVLAAIPATQAAQTDYPRQRALPIYREAWVQMRTEAWEQAAKGFQQAIDIDPKFEDAYYGLGRANMGLRRFDSAIAAYTKCQDMYRAEAGRVFASRQDA